ncbi:heme peroxidase, partial [Rhodotorula toruloides]
WQVASLIESRRTLGLKEYTDFTGWNPDKDTAETACRIYKHVDNLELYPVLMAEQPKPSQEGSGLAPGYTISHAILSDAAALVRGDRFGAGLYEALA